MADLIERDKVLHEIDQLSHAWEYGSAVDDCYEIVKKAQAVEIDEDMVIEYCRKRCLVIMTAELFAYWFMNKRIEEAYDGFD